MMAQHHDFDPPQALLVENVIRKTTQLRLAQPGVRQRRKLLGILLKPFHHGEKFHQKTIRQWPSRLLLVVIKHLAHVSRCQTVVNQFHVSRPRARRNSPCDMHTEGSRSISSERRKASATPSSSSQAQPGKESNNTAANFARSDSGRAKASDSISVSVTMQSNYPPAPSMSSGRPPSNIQHSKFPLPCPTGARTT
jgi:hypothetical protein